MDPEFLSAFDVAEDTALDALNGKEARKRRAFEESRLSYRHEPALIEPEWFVVGSARADGFDTERDLKEVEYTIQRLYFQQKYSDALSMCNSVMGAVAAADAPGNRTGSHSRELLDMAMRCALKLQDHRNAGELADQSKEYWDTLSGCAATAGQAYVLGGRPRDAITASLSALRNRAQLYPYLSLLCDASKAWKTQLEANASSSAPDALRGISSLAPILDIAAAKTHRVHPFRHDLLSSTGGHDREPFRRTQPPVTPLEDPPSSETVASWAIACGLSDREVEQIKSLCSYALAGSSEVHGDDAAGDDVGRSVRTL